MATKIFIFLSAIFLISCRSSEFDAEEVAKSYCDCLKSNSTSKDFLAAKTICDGSLLQSNRYFRINYIESTYGRYMVFLPKGLRDSSAGFNLRFYNYIEANCCKLAFENCNKEDSLIKQRQAVDSFLKK
ncbi:hypothetical protein D3H65_24430 [Paraflavitalea soli]|uniref:Lipoprotein n=1 Tax=Paraflavitalea soli TaxID=2315862 RepID=A0A3B7N421_9BACT|nr:hypothetical protein D3H65_24430 [Paraflavitalea soli]